VNPEVSYLFNISFSLNFTSIYDLESSFSIYENTFGDEFLLSSFESVFQEYASTFASTFGYSDGEWSNITMLDITNMFFYSDNVGDVSDVSTADVIEEDNVSNNDSLITIIILTFSGLALAVLLFFVFKMLKTRKFSDVELIRVVSARNSNKLDAGSEIEPGQPRFQFHEATPGGKNEVRIENGEKCVF